MFTFETTDQKEARRFRIAQFNGRTATARSAGATVTGHVRSIVENKSRIPVAWTITHPGSAEGRHREPPASPARFRRPLRSKTL